MVQFTSTLLQFAEAGDKTGWTYIHITPDIATALKPGCKKSFRVKGKLDKHPIKGVALIPHGGGSFILAVNAGMRKAISKKKGAMLQVQLQEDKTPQAISPELMECLSDDPPAMTFFTSLAPSHQAYFSKWIESAKTEATKTKRIAEAVNGLSRNMSYGELIRSLKKTD
ncbi:YdeI/OmpD-associated family protein [Paraflavitalea pollutisoli]|uniref:YdeI/OmpD-associated family protein n=1 Tax=Paraflavitalea pollutisoli TaxID=3034143 RepID=UPI0023ED3666|nr:YdeI/OmpD-associated family protein [Paraflavitalea sp. H1-2-19X]